jgi:hypothetical protein
MVSFRFARNNSHTSSEASVLESVSKGKVAN